MKLRLTFTGLLLIMLSVAGAQPKIGELAPEIVLPSLQGGTESLSSFKGKVVLIDFWASWCGPCRKANPALGKLYRKYRSQGFEIFGISLDEDKDDWKKAVLKDNIQWKQVNESGGWEASVAQAWKIEQLPTSYLLDKNGKIVAMDLSPRELESKLIRLLKK